MTLNVIDKVKYLGCILDQSLYGESMTLNVIDKVKYLGCILDQSLSGESMALNVIDKVNALIQPFFDSACRACFSNLLKRFKFRLQASQISA